MVVGASDQSEHTPIAYDGLEAIYANWRDCRFGDHYIVTAILVRRGQRSALLAHASRTAASSINNPRTTKTTVHAVTYTVMCFCSSNSSQLAAG